MEQNPSDNMTVIADNASDADTIRKFMNTSSEDINQQMVQDGVTVGYHNLPTVNIYIKFTFKDPDLTESVGVQTLDCNTDTINLSQNLLHLMVLEAYMHFKTAGQDLKSIEFIDRDTYEKLAKLTDNACTTYGYTDNGDEMTITKKTDSIKSNFQMLTALLTDFHPQHLFLTLAETNLVTDKLCLRNMDLLSLQNLRDFTVLYLSQPNDCLPKNVAANKLTNMSAITAVIDHWIIQKGGSV